jgi:oligogalacturonide lyase
MIGQTWPSEMREFKDKKTGKVIRQLTTTGNNFHMYFTDNSFNKNQNAIIFHSDRTSGEYKPVDEAPRYNLFHMDLDTGVITQLTDEVQSVWGTKTPDGQIIVYATGKQLKKLEMRTGQVSVLYEGTGKYTLEAPFIAPNLRYVAFCRNEELSLQYGANYLGFKEGFYLTKNGRITVAFLDGSGWFDIFQDTHQLGHFQFCPDDSTLGTFCHEGPWHLVTQRIWLLDFVAREVQPIFRQAEVDSVGHEFWTQDGYIFFDNRGPGHDGTITSDRTQAVAIDVAVKQMTMIPFIGLADRTGKIIRKIELPYYCNHYHANPDNTFLVGDDIDDLVLIDISGEQPILKTLSNHKTSWKTSESHCHPTWSWDGSRILYASDYGGKVNLYLIEPFA